MRVDNETVRFLILSLEATVADTVAKGQASTNKPDMDTATPAQLEAADDDALA